MNTRNTSDDQEKFKEAGEQAARVLGEFVSMANEFSRRFEKDFDSRADSRAQQTQDRSSTQDNDCLLYTSPSPRDKRQSRMPSSA